MGITEAHLVGGPKARYVYAVLEDEVSLKVSVFDKKKGFGTGTYIRAEKPMEKKCPYAANCYSFAWDGYDDKWKKLKQ